MLFDYSIKELSRLAGLDLVFNCETHNMMFVKDFELVFETVAPVTVFSQMLQCPLEAPLKELFRHV